jgi:hypothetical protein
MKPKTFARMTTAGLALWAGILACTLPGRAVIGEERTETESVDPGSATSAQVEITFPAGELRVEDGAGGLMDATFTYNVAEWQPLVEYSVEGGQGDLKVSQPGAEGTDNLPFVSSAGEMVNDWTIQLSSGMPLDLSIMTGAGETTLLAGGLDLNNLSVQTGAGVTNLDLTGSWTHDVHVSVQGGVGDLRIDLPAEMGVRVNSSTALVAVSTFGLTEADGGYVNDAYGAAPYTLTLDLEAGVGSVELRVP